MPAAASSPTITAMVVARHRIRVNAPLPAYVVADLNRDFLHSESGDRLRARIPSRSYGEMADLDGLLLLRPPAALRLRRGNALGKILPSETIHHYFAMMQIRS